MAHDAKQKYLTLPVSVVNLVDIGRLLGEAQAVDDFLEQAAIREPGTSLSLPKMSKTLDEMVSANRMNLLVKDERRALIELLTTIHQKSPQLHMSFSAEPSPAFMQELTQYLREHIHPYALIQVGLQPTIGAGFMLRTTNKYYDFSLRTALKSKRDLLMKSIRERPVSTSDSDAAALETAEVPA